MTQNLSNWVDKDSVISRGSSLSPEPVEEESDDGSRQCVYFSADEAAQISLHVETVHLERAGETIMVYPKWAVRTDGQVSQERHRHVSGGMKKIMVWKKVFLELDTDHIEMWKTSEKTKSHGSVCLLQVIRDQTE